jgi:hypothetical protein
MLKRFGVLGTTLAVVALSAVTASSASAALCYKVDPGESSKFKNSICTEEEAGGKWIHAEPVLFLDFDEDSQLWCAKLDTGELTIPAFPNPGCTGTKAVGNDYIKILVPGAVGTLPDISVTLGGSYPVHAQGSVANALTALSTTSGVALSGSGVTLLLLTTELSALGTFTSTFTKVKNSESIECNTTGDAKGVVLVKGEFHLVLAPMADLGILFLVSEFEVECPTGINVLVRGNLIGSVTNIGNETSELTGFGGVLEGSKGKQSLSEYINSTGTAVKAKLESEAGAGFAASAENVSEEVKLEVLGSQMIVINPR